jgi:NitT/TauT family transport system permease protein/taurine transport system permease protein
MQLTVGGGAVLVALAIWFGTSALIDTTRFPAPRDVYSAGLQLLTTGYAGGTLLMHMLHSMKLALLGFVFGTACGFPLGLVMGYSRTIEALVNPIFFFIRPIPPLAWIPLAIVWFGLGDAAKIFVIWFSAFVPILINTYTGVRSVDPTLLSAARVYGADQRIIVAEVIIPAALPMIFGGLRISLQASWMALVAAELVGAFYGLGRVLMIAAQDIYPGMIVVAMACVAVAGMTMTKVLGLLERAALPWLKPAQ